MKYVIIRSFSFGVFAGYLMPESTENTKIIKNARRLWYWEGAASLSELATKGTSKPDQCKFPVEVEQIEVTSPEGFEILLCTEQAKESIKSVPVWSAHE